MAVAVVMVKMQNVVVVVSLICCLSAIATPAQPQFFYCIGYFNSSPPVSHQQNHFASLPLQLLRLETPDAAEGFLDGVGFQLLVPLLEQLTELGEVCFISMSRRVCTKFMNHTNLSHVVVQSLSTLWL